MIVHQNAGDPVSKLLAKTTFTILNDDTATSWTITPAPAAVSVSARCVTLTHTRANPIAAQTVYVSTTQTEGFTNNNDYVGLASQPLSFAIGESSKTVTVSIINDS